MRGPGCLFGSVAGLAAGVAAAVAVFVGLARWAPGILDRAQRVATGTEESGDAGRDAIAPGRARVEEAARGDKRAPTPGEMALRIRMRHRLRRLEAEAKTGTQMSAPVEFSEAEIQAALTDPQGPLKGTPRGLEADLLPGKVRLSWPLLPESGRSGWLAPLARLEASVDLEPRIEKGRLVCPPVSGSVGGIPIPRRLIAELAPALPSAPRLPPLAGFALPSGTSSVKVLTGRLRLEPAADPQAKPKR